jgi:hypothetical protein
MKVSVYVEDEVWKKFKRNVLRKTGELRSLSSEVQELIRDNSGEDSLRKGFEKIMKTDLKPISSSQVNPVEASVRTSSATAIRKMRDRHIVSEKDLSRQ